MRQDFILDTPVAILIFRRPSQTRKLIDSLRLVSPKKIYVIADGAREGVAGEAQLVDNARLEIAKIDWPTEIIRVYSDKNLGLRERTLTGLDFVFDRETDAIILEDDCIPSLSFFQFSSELLDRYKEDTEVSMICGSNFSPMPKLSDAYFFYTGCFIWGWASWARTWQDFRRSPQVEKWSEGEQKEIMQTFSSAIASRAFKPLMFLAEGLNTWDVSFDVFLRMRGYVSIVPNINLVANIGFGDGSTNTKFESLDSQSISEAMAFPLNHPGKIEASVTLEKKMWRMRLFRWLLLLTLHPWRLAMPLAIFLTRKRRAGRRLDFKK
jgi:hypothetical protein